jgi:hypothetical protein
MTLSQLDRHYFWVTRHNAIIQELERYFDDVVDVSYVNDTTASVEINDKYYLYMPNSTRCNPDNEEYNYYMIVESEHYGTDAKTIHCETLDKAIDELEQLLNN